MKYFIDYDDSNNEILGFLTSDTKSQNQGITQEVSRVQLLESQKFNKIVINGDNISFETFDFRTQQEIDEEIESKKWDDFDTFKETLQVTVDSGSTFLASPKNLMIWIIKTHGEGASKLEPLWVEDWDTYIDVPMSDFTEAISKANKAIDDKLIEILGA